MKKLNNKGFSLVELIIVIAIMAILAAALAPQLMKYIEKSRVSTDKQTCDSIKSCVNTATAEDDVYKEVTATAGTVIVEVSSSGIATGTGSSISSIPKLKAELESSLGSGGKLTPKSSGANKFIAKIVVDASGNITSVTVDTDTGVMSK